MLSLSKVGQYPQILGVCSYKKKTAKEQTKIGIAMAIKATYVFTEVGNSISCTIVIFSVRAEF